MDEITLLKQRIELLENFIADFVYSDRYISQKHFQFLDSKNISFGTTNGTRIGTTITQKIGLYGATPVIQANAISAPNNQGGIYNQTDITTLKTAIDAIRVALTNLGITA